MNFQQKRFGQKAVAAGGFRVAFQKFHQLLGFSFCPVGGGRDQTHCVPRLRLFAFGQTKQVGSRFCPDRGIRRIQQPTRGEQGGFALLSGFGGGGRLGFELPGFFRFAPQSQEIGGNPRHLGVAASGNADFFQEFVGPIEPTRPDRGAQIGCPVRRGGLTAFRQGPPIGEGFRRARPLIHIRQHPECADIARIEGVGGAGCLKSIDQSPLANRLFRSIHQLIRTPSLHCPISRQGCESGDDQDDQQKKAQGQPTFEACEVRFLIPESHGFSVALPPAVPKLLRGLGGKKFRG